MAKKMKFDTSAEADMTPMIDMTFQLIAFFMVLINFAEDNQDQRIKLPGSVLAKPPEGAMESPLTLQMTKQGTVIFAADEIPLAGLGKFLDIEVQLLRRANKSPGNANVIIRADSTAPTGTVQELIKLCQDKQFEKFSLRAKQESR